METVLAFWPSIPEPPTGIKTAHQNTRPDPNLNVANPVDLYINPRHKDRLAETLKQDIARHGGFLLQEYDEARRYTFAVPAPYLERIRELTESSGTRPPRPAYRHWAHKIHDNPKNPDITGPANVAITFQLQHPWFSGRFTFMAAVVAATLMGFAILATPLAILTHWLFQTSRAP